MHMNKYKMVSVVAIDFIVQSARLQDAAMHLCCQDPGTKCFCCCHWHGCARQQDVAKRRYISLYVVTAHDLNVHGINTLPASVVMSSEIIQEKEKCWTSCCCCCFHWLGCARQQDFASLRQGWLLCLHQPGSWSRRAECWPESGKIFSLKEALIMD